MKLLKENARPLLIAFVAFSFGLLAGGYLFNGIKPRSLLALNRCDHCMGPEEVTGLLAAVGIQKAGWVPFVVFETDKTIVVAHPHPRSRIHYVLLPKKDIKAVGDLSDGDQAYLIDAYAVAAQLIHEKNLYRYRFYTNGPGFQAVGYLHFHLVAP